MSDVTSPNVSDAKARAEARRKRILEASKSRLNVVSGLEPKKDEVKIELTSSTELQDTAESSPLSTETEGNANPELSSAQKVAQMRRRRYAQKLKDEEMEHVDESHAIESIPEDVHVQNTEALKQKENAVLKEQQKQEEEQEEEDRTSTTGQEPKKYLGVAKLRRMKIAEKKAAEEEAAAAAAVESNHHISPEVKARILASRKTVHKLPALVQLLTVVALFLSGLDVGIQNHVIWRQNVPHVHENLSYYDHGVGAFNKLTNKMNRKSQEALTDIFASDGSLIQSSNQEDEFESSESTPKPAGAAFKASPASNLDPVFGVDFDELTAGSGFFFTCARFAVSVHRAVYRFFFDIPKSILLSILSIPKKMIVHPPIMFLCAVLIRYVGKHLLGGNIPDMKDILEADENLDKVHALSTGTGSASDNKMGGAVDKLVSTNFMAMGGDYVKNYMKDHFPKATLAFTVFKDARADMLIVLCGFFVGLVLPVTSGVGAKRVRDEF